MKYLAILALIVTQALACNPPAYMVKRTMAAQEYQNFDKITDQHLKDREESKRTGTWRPLKIYFDLSRLNAKLTELPKPQMIPFYKKVFEATAAWWGNVLKVNDNKELIMPTMKEGLQSLRVGSNLEGFAGLADADMTKYDLVVPVLWAEKYKNGTLAWAVTEQRHPKSQRPISGYIGVEKYGNDLWELNTDKKIAFQKAMATIIHEFGHIIAFNGWENFQEKNLYTINDGGEKNYYWKGKKAVEVAKNYYKCSGDFKGLPLEKMPTGELGGHWEEDWFGPEGMSPEEGTEPELFSAMTLALCEDSGWYQVDYGMAENYEFGKGTGCEDKNCAKQFCNLETDKGRQIGPDKTWSGFCGQNKKTGCGAFQHYKGKTSKTVGLWPKDNITFGASYGDNSVVVLGNFESLDDDGNRLRSRNDLSVEATCNWDQSSYTLKFKGAEYDDKYEKTGKDVMVTCKAAGDVFYNESSPKIASTVKCEDPMSFCKATSGGRELCPKMCDNSGRCAHKANTTAGPVDSKTLVSKKMLAGTKTITLLESVGKKIGSNGWACWCFNYGAFSTEESGSCPNALKNN